MCICIYVFMFIQCILYIYIRKCLLYIYIKILRVMVFCCCFEWTNPFRGVGEGSYRLVQKSNFSRRSRLTLNNKGKSTISRMWAEDGQVCGGRSKQPILVTKLQCRGISAFSRFPTFLVQLPRMASSVYTSSLL